MSSFGYICNSISLLFPHQSLLRVQSLNHLIDLSSTYLVSSFGSFSLSPSLFFQTLTIISLFISSFSLSVYFLLFLFLLYTFLSNFLLKFQFISQGSSSVTQNSRYVNIFCSEFTETSSPACACLLENKSFCPPPKPPSSEFEFIFPQLYQHFGFCKVQNPAYCLLCLLFCRCSYEALILC